MATATVDQSASYPSTLTKGPSSRLYEAFTSDLWALLDESLENEPATAEKVIVDVLEVTSRARELLTQSWISPRVATDGNGGVRLNWRFNRRELRAVIPQDDNLPRYLYWEEDSLFNTVENFTPASLWYWMNWLQGRDARAR
jgi:hypothetical protein